MISTEITSGQSWNEVTQTILHDPDDGLVIGNCLQAAVASVLRLPLNAVPHFSAFLWWTGAVELWARGRGLTYKMENTSSIPDRLAIIGGVGPRGFEHVVVGFQGEVVWDPHPSRAGLVSIDDASWFEEGFDGGRCWFCHDPWIVQSEEVAGV